MQKAANFVAKYSTANKSKAVVPYDKIKATEKWLEYSLDIVDMNKILMKSDFNTKWQLMEALDIAERKRKYMYNHKNFELRLVIILPRLSKPQSVSVITGLHRASYR